MAEGRPAPRRRDRVRTTPPAATWTASRPATGPAWSSSSAAGTASSATWPSGESILVKPPALLYKDPTVGYADARRVPRRRDEAVADLGQPVPVAAGVGARAGWACSPATTAWRTRAPISARAASTPSTLVRTAPPAPGRQPLSRHHPIKSRYKHPPGTRFLAGPFSVKALESGRVVRTGRPPLCFSMAAIVRSREGQRRDIRDAPIGAAKRAGRCRRPMNQLRPRRARGCGSRTPSRGR